MTADGEERRGGRSVRLASGAYRARIMTVAASLCEFSFGGRDLVVPFDPTLVRTGYHGMTLAPWPNRVVDGRYSFGGREHRLQLTEPERGHAAHGLVDELDFDIIERTRERVRLRGRIPAQPGYPWCILLDVVYELGDEGLLHTVVAENTSSSTAPFGAAPHPYLVAGAGPMEEWSLLLQADRVLEVTHDRLIPTRTRPVAERPDLDFGQRRRLGVARIDHAFTGFRPDGDGVVTLELTTDSGSGVAMSWESSSPWVQLYTADAPAERWHRAGVAVEPMTCPPDAFNSGIDLIELPPQGRTEVAWRIHAIDRAASPILAP